MKPTCRRLGQFQLGDSCRPGSWGSCSARAGTCRTAPPRNPRDTGTGQSPGHTARPRCPHGDTCTACSRGTGPGPSCPLRTARRPRPPSAAGTRSGPCPGHTRGPAQGGLIMSCYYFLCHPPAGCRGRTSCSRCRRCPSSRPCRRRTAARPPRACRHTDQ